MSHGIVGFAIVLLSPWKSVIARRGLARDRSGKGVSIALSYAVVVALTFGLFHSTGILRSMGGITAMQVHVGAALVAFPLALIHVIRRRIRIHRVDLSRRQLARASALLGGAGIAYVAVEGVLRGVGLPGRLRRSTGSYEQGSFVPDEMPVTQWLNDSVPEIDVDGWRLRISAGGTETSMEFEELTRHSDRLRATLDCTGGWYAHQDWERRLVFAVVAGRHPRPQHLRGVGHRVLSSVPAARCRQAAACDAPRRRTPICRPWRAGPHRCSGPARILVGEVGGGDFGERRTVVGAVAVPADVRKVVPSTSQPRQSRPCRSPFSRSEPSPLARR